MNNGMSKPDKPGSRPYSKPVQIENLPLELHEAVKARSKQLGILTYQGYIDGMERWLAEADERSYFTLEQMRRLHRFFNEPKNLSDKMLGKVLREILDKEYS